MKNTKWAIGLWGLLVLAGNLGAASLWARGMPTEQKETIHGLFDAHKKISRHVEETEDGYRSVTTSDDPEAVKMLQEHVSQMEGRMMDGRMVRGWDPAYVEFVNHYEDVTIDITNLENGVSVVAVGKTEEAKKILQNHAQIISKFVDKGWAEHDVIHPAVASESGKEADGGAIGKLGCCSGNSGGSCGSGSESSCKAGEGNSTSSCCMVRSE